jgi:hypothetical protein
VSSSAPHPLSTTEKGTFSLFVLWLRDFYGPIPINDGVCQQVQRALLKDTFFPILNSDDSNQVGKCSFTIHEGRYTELNTATVTKTHFKNAEIN